MNILQAIVYGIVEGATEFLPVSSTAHLLLTPKLLGWENPPTSFVALIQLGPIAAVIFYFWKDLSAAFLAWAKSLAGGPKDSPEVRTGWAVFAATAIISVIGFALHKLIEGPLKSVWMIASALIVMSFVMVAAEKFSKKNRELSDVTLMDGVKVGLWQCVALIPGTSRSGATISGALFGNFNREAAARLSFLMSVPAITLAGLYEGAKEYKGLSAGNLVVPTLIATVVGFAVGYACIKWLMSFLQRKGVTPFIWYRIALGAILLVLCLTGKIDPNARFQEPAAPASHSNSQ